MLLLETDSYIPPWGEAGLAYQCVKQPPIHNQMRWSPDIELLLTENENASWTVVITLCWAISCPECYGDGGHGSADLDDSQYDTAINFTHSVGWLSKTERHRWGGK